MNSATEIRQLAERFVNQTGKHIFLTGKAGTGKTTFLKHIVETTHKRVIVAAPTGVAALNAGGVTIHSQFQLPLAGFIPDHSDMVIASEFLRFETRKTLPRHLKMRDEKREALRQLELLIIDEVSMLRADILDAIELVLQHIRHNNQSFGGVQVLFIGDLLQLPPVVKKEEWEVLQHYYETPFFFSAKALQNHPPVYLELTKIYRQADPVFTRILNNIRQEKLTSEDIQLLNQRYKPDFEPPADQFYIYLTTHNRFADSINQEKMDALPGRAFEFTAEVNGDFPEHLFPCAEELILKKNAQVMFIKNDPDGAMEFINGTIGKVVKLDDEDILVELEDGKTIYVPTFEWKNIRYSVDPKTKNITEEVLGTFIQYPLRPAWAITVHKSQGLTFDRAILDVQKVFASGQAYVAFSRLRSIEGLILSAPANVSRLGINSDILTFSENFNQKENLKPALEKAEVEFLREFAISAFDLRPLLEAWRDHIQTYQMAENKSPKQKNLDWATGQYQTLKPLQEVSVKFRTRIEEIAINRKHLNLLRERLTSGADWFSKPLSEVLIQLLNKKDEMKKIRKTKGYVQELTELEMKMENCLSNMFKAGKLTQNLLEEKTLDKNAWIKSFDAPWRKDCRVTENSTSKRKEDKTPSHLDTYNLFKSGCSFEEIAEKRNLAISTIEGHFGKLIKQGLVEPDEILPPDKMKRVFEVESETEFHSLMALKDKLGEDFSFSEARWILTWINRSKSQ